MAQSENTSFWSLAQRVAANDPKFNSFSDFVFAPLAEALAKIGIWATKIKALHVLSSSSEAIAQWMTTNTTVWHILTSSANDGVYDRSIVPASSEAEKIAA